MPGDALKDARTVPLNFGPLRGAAGNARVTGPCGDTMEFWFGIRDGRVSRVTYTTDGCGHSVAAGSAAARLAEGRTVEGAAAVSQADVLEAVGGLPEDSRHCALLAADTLRAALADHLKRHGTPARDANGDRDGREDDRALRDRLDRIAHTILVLSGKGGVGKSTVTVNLAAAMARVGRRVGILDADIHGPSIPTMLRIEGSPLTSDGSALVPVTVGGMRVMSIGFLIPRRDDAVIWRGPKKMHLLEQFLRDVAWGDLDCLVVDLPPGTGDEPLSVCQLVGKADGAVVVTTPQDVATADVRRSIGFCRALQLPVLGIVENMSGFACPHCSRTTDVFKAGGGERLAREMGVPFLGRVPLDAAVGEACDGGIPYIERFAGTETARAFGKITAPLLQLPARNKTLFV
jgi:Mrp family chromosome partitioning ATPase